MSFLTHSDTTGSTGNDHEHRYAVDPHGDGSTDIINDHIHLIINGKMMSAGDDDHTHDDVEYPLKEAMEDRDRVF